jgi:hypothetical protein
MHDALPVRKHFDISALSEPQLELRLHWFGRALAVRDGYIVDVKRRRSGAGEHVASIAYEMPLPRYPRRPRARGSKLAHGSRRGHERT